MELKVLLFDLYGTVVFIEDPVGGRFVSDFLVSRGYEVYPQALDAAWHYVAFVDYPKFGFGSWEAWLKQICNRLNVQVDDQTVKEWSSFYKIRNWKLYSDVIHAFTEAKMLGLKTAIVTSIAKFMYTRALKPIMDKVDLLVDSFTFNCEKSNPKIYRETLKALNAKPKQAVMIGNEQDVDILLPKRLGMQAIFINRTGKTEPKPFKIKPDAIVSDLKEAIKIVEEWIKPDK
jgi:FMN phosphatase YigB (HAD superfamily)